MQTLRNQEDTEIVKKWNRSQISGTLNCRMLSDRPNMQTNMLTDRRTDTLMLNPRDLQRMSDLHFHLLLWCAISMADDGDDTAQLHPEWGRGVHGTIFNFSRKRRAHPTIQNTVSDHRERWEVCVRGAGVSESLGVNVWTLCVCTLKLHLEIYMIKTCIFLHIKQDIKPQNAEKLHIDTSLTLNSDSGCNF